MVLLQNKTAGANGFSDRCISLYYSKVFWNFFQCLLELRTAEQGKGNDGTETGMESKKGIQGHWPCEREDGVVKQGEIK